MNSQGPIGFFDSGVGGLSVWREVVKLLPEEDTVYIGDGANCPYGFKPPEMVVELSRFHANGLIARGAKLVVVACNTATAAAISTLRAEHPDIPFVGMEPAVKPAVLHTASGVVGVLATAGTFRGRLYWETCERFAKGTCVLMCVADEFVSLVERGVTDGAEAEAVVEKRLRPLLDAGADHIVLGCTHFPFLKGVMERVAGSAATIVDPSAAVARQVKRLLDARGLARSSNPTPSHIFETTGDRQSFYSFLARID